MLKQVLQQNASNGQAKSNQSQRQIVARHLLVFGMPVETTIHSSLTYPRTARNGWMGEAR